MSTLAVHGSEQLAAVGRSLVAAPRRYRSRMRRNIAIASAPIVSETRSGWQSGYGHLGADLAAATRLRVLTAGPSVGVTIRVEGSRLPDGKQTLPPLVEGYRPWRKPLFGDTGHWYPQDPHPELGPAVARHLPGVQIGVITAIEETLQAIARGVI